MRVDPILEMSDEIIKKESSKSLINGAITCLLLISIVFVYQQKNKNRKLKSEKKDDLK
jgi:hypothetical protein